MLTVVKLSLIDRIEEAITIPRTGYFVKNETSIRLCYSIEKAIKYINLPSPEAVAKFLKKHGVINSYAIKNDQVIMYTKSTTCISGKGGVIVWQERLVPYRWEDIDLNPLQVQTFAAVHEFELANNTMGKIFKNFLQVA